MADSKEALTEVDSWILSCLNTLVKGVTKELENFDPTRAGRLIDAFVNDDLSNWYVRLNRKRFWGKEMSADKLAAYRVLYTCLMTVSKLLAPFAPFFADQLYKDLKGELESVHLDRFRRSMRLGSIRTLRPAWPWLRRLPQWFSPCAVR